MPLPEVKRLYPSMQGISTQVMMGQYPNFMPFVDLWQCFSSAPNGSLINGCPDVTLFARGDPLGERADFFLFVNGRLSYTSLDVTAGEAQTMAQTLRQTYGEAPVPEVLGQAAPELAGGFNDGITIIDVLKDPAHHQFLIQLEDLPAEIHIADEATRAKEQQANAPTPAAPSATAPSENSSTAAMSNTWWCQSSPCLLQATDGTALCPSADTFDQFEQWMGAHLSDPHDAFVSGVVSFVASHGCVGLDPGTQVQGTPTGEGQHRMHKAFVTVTSGPRQGQRGYIDDLITAPWTVVTSR